MQFFIDSVTASAGTAIQAVIPASGSGIPLISELKYSCSTTAHTLTIMRPIAHTETVAGSVSGGTVLYLKSSNFGRTTANASETLAASDYLIWVDRYGGYHFDTVSSVSGTDITMSNALTQDVNAETTVWGCYELARSTHFTVTMEASKVTTVTGVMAGFTSQSGIRTSRSGAGDPLLISIDNATAAGNLIYCAGSYQPSDNQITT